MNDHDIYKKAQRYIAEETDPSFRDHISQLVENNDIKALRDRFFTDATFGTGGLRSMIGGGSTRINPLIIRRTTQALATYLKDTRARDDLSVVIAYDSRHYSRAFAQYAASVLCANGIHTFLFTQLRPTPELSFAVRQLQADAGIVITASHNPSEYNGYKVYWTDGGQIVAPHDQGIIERVHTVARIEDMAYDDAVARGLCEEIDERVDVPFVRMCARQRLHPTLPRSNDEAITIVYTPLHGTGGVHIPGLLKECGFRVKLVDTQVSPDPDFPTVTSPNPEERSAMDAALRTAADCKADLVMGTDPDADRIAVGVTDDHITYTLLDGNQVASLLTYYLLSSRAEQDALPENGYVVKTIVTSELIRAIADAFGVACVDTLTGFKYIADTIHQKERADTGETFLFGCEESYGYLAETDTRDKNAVSTAVLLADMVQYYATQQTTLLQQMRTLYARFGYFHNQLVSRYFHGEQGRQKMDAFMHRMRTDPPHRLGPLSVTRVMDYKNRVEYPSDDPEATRPITLPVSDVMQFVCEDGSVVTTRPSGTEPKMKMYVAACSEPTGDDLDSIIRDVEDASAQIIASIDSIINTF